MGRRKTTRFWRVVNAVLATRPGAKLAEITRAPINKLSGLMARSKRERPTPWAPFTKKFPEARLAIVTTAGLHVEGDPPFDIDDVRGDATFREIPADVDPRRLRIAHAHYPHQRFLQDHNVILPLDRLHELVAAGALGGLSPRIFSFGWGGGLTREYIDPKTGTAHEVARRLQADGADFVLFVPT